MVVKMIGKVISSTFQKNLSLQLDVLLNIVVIMHTINTVALSTHQLFPAHVLSSDLVPNFH